MPNVTPFAADTVRTCSANLTHAHPITLLLTEENFFHRRRANGELWIDARCQSCRRFRDREVRRLRAAGTPVRARRRAASARKFGVEIEYLGSSRDLLVAMRTVGLECESEGYNHRVSRAWKIVPDGSIHGGYELVSPPLSGEAGIREVELACQALQTAGATVSRACGLHVHHEVRDLDAPALGRLFRGWSRNQSNINALVAASRRNSQWAQPLSEMEVARVEALRSTDSDVIRRAFSGYIVDRYRALNIASYPRYGTVEVRQHQGSLNASKIIAWVRFGQALIAAAVAGDVPAADSIGDLIAQLVRDGGLPADTATFLLARAEHFQRRPVAA